MPGSKVSGFEVLQQWETELTSVLRSQSSVPHLPHPISIYFYGASSINQLPIWFAQLPVYVTIYKWAMRIRTHTFTWCRRALTNELTPDASDFLNTAPTDWTSDRLRAKGASSELEPVRPREFGESTLLEAKSMMTHRNWNRGTIICAAGFPNLTLMES